MAGLADDTFADVLEEIDVVGALKACSPKKSTNARSLGARKRLDGQMTRIAPSYCNDPGRISASVPSPICFSTAKSGTLAMPIPISASAIKASVEFATSAVGSIRRASSTLKDHFGTIPVGSLR